jgi:hypothetical protein
MAQSLISVRTNIKVTTGNEGSMITGCCRWWFSFFEALSGIIFAFIKGPNEILRIA